jgi:hypothetical protein
MIINEDRLQMILKEEGGISRIPGGGTFLNMMGLLGIKPDTAAFTNYVQKTSGELVGWFKARGDGIINNIAAWMAKIPSSMFYYLGYKAFKAGQEKELRDEIDKHGIDFLVEKAIAAAREFGAGDDGYLRMFQHLATGNSPFIPAIRELKATFQEFIPDLFGKEDIKEDMKSILSALNSIKALSIDTNQLDISSDEASQKIIRAVQLGSGTSANKRAHLEIFDAINLALRLENTDARKVYETLLTNVKKGQLPLLRQQMILSLMRLRYKAAGGTIMKQNIDTAIVAYNVALFAEDNSALVKYLGTVRGLSENHFQSAISALAKESMRQRGGTNIRFKDATGENIAGTVGNIWSLGAAAALYPRFIKRKSPVAASIERSIGNDLLALDERQKAFILNALEQRTNYHESYGHPFLWLLMIVGGAFPLNTGGRST